jgi:hypothetical protein
MALVKAFRCSRTGLYFPGDYVEEWGRKYGQNAIGSQPVSEALITDYSADPVAGPDGKTMHPMVQCRAQVDYCEVEEETFMNNQAILHSDDQMYKKRAEIMRYKQLLKSNRVSSKHPDEIDIAREFVEAFHTRGTTELKNRKLIEKSIS